LAADLDFLSCDLMVKINTRGKWKDNLAAPIIIIHLLTSKLTTITSINTITDMEKTKPNIEKKLAMTGTVSRNSSSTLFLVDLSGTIA
jgi:hypothetical protein